MFCPECRAEYIEGITECKDCKVPLVEALPPQQPYNFIEILSTFNLGDIAMIKSLLDSEEIAYYFIGENFNRLDQLVQPARLIVREDHVERAREVLGDFNLRYIGLVGDQEDEKDE
jgi:hypothetical protein